MGIHDRDYYRENTRGMFDSWGRWSATTWLIVISCVTFAIQVLSAEPPGPSPFFAYGCYDFTKIRGGEIWRLITPTFLEIPRVLGFIFSMITLYWAGSRIEARYGSREFIHFYLLAGVLAYGSLFLVQLVGWLPPSIAVGPRPAIIALLVVFACHYPHERIILFVVPVPAWLLVVGYVAFAILATAGSPVPFSAYIAGALFGFVYYWFELHVSHFWPAMPRRPLRRAQPKLRVIRPEEMDEFEREIEEMETPPPAAPAETALELTVDRVLEKVSKFGQGSLTPAEREVLFRASEVYKKRRQ